jgi:hypothetical protein
MLHMPELVFDIALATLIHDPDLRHFCYYDSLHWPFD